MHRSIPSVLVLGDGLLGSEIVKQTGWDYISRKKDGFDITKPQTFKLFFTEIHHGVIIENKYDIIINCIANTDTYSEDQDAMKATNYYGVIDLADYCLKNKIKLVQISSDYVYANSKPFASELDLPLVSPNWYTYYKALIDEILWDRYFNVLVCRCSFKPNPFPYDKAWDDVIGNFDSVDVIAGLIIKLINRGACGIFNVGTEIKSVYDLAKRTNPNVQPIKSPIHAPKDITMDITRMTNVIERTD
jgi:dTDP-4-dehydrorhamnose reductase